MAETKGEPRKGIILIVDDQPVNIQGLSNLLKDEYDILAATSGAKALEIARSNEQPDLILLDIEMPDMNGYEVCRLLKDNDTTRRIPIIFVTAKDNEEDEEEGLHLGAVDYITKPFRPAIARMRVRTHMHLKQQTDMLEQLSRYDGLTNVPNRRYFDEQLEKGWERMRREENPFSIIMIDVDHFKTYNDNYGHGAGDICLQKIAGTLSAHMPRSTDLLARYGGEEFVALLVNTDSVGALTIAEKLRKSIEALEIPHHYSATASVVTVSMGTATASTANDITPDAAALLNAADTALYTAKKDGRNRVAQA